MARKERQRPATVRRAAEARAGERTRSAGRSASDANPSPEVAVDMIEMESQESFPASDAPSWTTTRVGEPVHVNEGATLAPVHPSTSPEVARRRRELAPDVQAAFDAFSEKVFADDALSPKTKQLIAVAVAHVMQCPYCIRVHTKAALRHGATPQELMEAIWVAAEMRAGGAYAHSAVSLTAMKEASEAHQT